MGEKGDLNKISVQRLVAVPVSCIVLCVIVTILTLPVLEKILIVQKPLSRADALVVMAGGETEARIAAAAKLYHGRVSDTILLTNDGVLGAWSVQENRNLFQVEWTEIKLQEMRVPKKAIRKLAYLSSGTIYDALMARDEVVKQGMRRVIIVTSDYHSKRSLWSFKRVFSGLQVEIGVAPVDIANENDIKKTELLIIELFKYICYRIEYGVFDSILNHST